MFLTVPFYIIDLCFVSLSFCITTIIIILCDNCVPLFSLICRFYFSFHLHCLFTSSFVDAFPLSTFLYHWSLFCFQCVSALKSLSLLIYTIGCSIASHGGFFFSPLMGVMCGHEHLCVVATPATGCFQYVCHLTYIFCSIGVLQLVAVTMCVLSAMLTPVRSCFSVLCWYVPVWSCVYSIVYCSKFYSQPDLASDTNIFASVFQFLFLLASDALQAFISYQDVITWIYLE